MAGWQYITATIDTGREPLAEALNRFGRDGWEMIQCEPAKGDRFFTVFKREAA